MSCLLNLPEAALSVQCPDVPKKMLPSRLIRAAGFAQQRHDLRGVVAYGRTKGGVAQLARGMACELAGDGIT
jgi:NAD(P)-dependent dehydrogenase (short-subunit alcohol dehydrogenase family)